MTRLLQPDVYPFAARLAGLHGCRHLIALGRGRTSGLAELHPEFELLEVDSRADEDLRPEVAARSVIVSTGAVDEPRDPRPLLRSLRRLLDSAPVALLSSERDLDEARRLLEEASLRISFIGLTASHDDGFPKETVLALLESPSGPLPALEPAPDGFRVIALMPTYNEEDVVGGTIAALASEGVETYVIDNWSTDGTPAVVEGLRSRGVTGVERFPASAPSPQYQWRAILKRTEELTQTLDASWFLHVDADERPRSPWPGVSLRDAFWHVDRCGFNCVDHTTLTFQPVDDGFRDGDVERQLRFCEFGQGWDAFHQVKAWKNLGVPIERGHAGGHDTVFEGRRVYPYKFLRKHYPIRSQAHGERKVHRERASRWSAAEREEGWHVHYDGIGPGHRFVRDSSELIEFDEERFQREFLVERLSGIGVGRLAAP